MPPTKKLNALGLALAVVCARTVQADPALPDNILSTIYNVSTYGAHGDGTTDNTTAIQSAINAAGVAGGGTVEIPAGTFLCGPITLVNNLNLQLDAGAVLRMLPRDQYPGGTVSPANFISGTRLHDIKISGSGAVDGQGSSWWRALESDKNIPRPYMINLSACSRILVQDVTLSNSPAQFLVIKGNAGNVTVQRVTILAPASQAPVNPSHNTDGIDIGETNALIRDCLIDTGDDHVAVGTSSANTSDILITNCTFREGHGVSIGSTFTSRSVSNLTVINCTFTHSDQGIRIKSDRLHGGLVKNVSYLNLGMTDVQYPIIIYGDYSASGNGPNLNNLTPAMIAAIPAGTVTPTTPMYRDILFSNITATAQSGRIAGLVWGLPEALVTNVTFTKVNITADKAFGIYNARGVQFVDSRIITPPGVNNLSTTNAEITFTFTVTSLADDGGSGELRQVIQNATAGSMIAFAPNLSGQTITLRSGELLLNKNLTIDASSVGGITIDGGNQGRVFQVSPPANAVFNSLTITHGRAPCENGRCYGGGIYNFQATATLNNCTLTGNYADSDGGALWNSGTMIVNQCTISGNTATYVGAGIFNTGILSVNQSTITGNTNERVGAGILNNSDAILNLTNSIVAGNTNTQDNWNGKDLWFMQNFGPEHAGELHARNNYINIDPQAPPHVNDAANNLPGNDPMLEPLGNHGGQTQTMPPQNGSPVIGKGAPTTLTTDQRGYTRPDPNHPDIGAVQHDVVQNNAVKQVVPQVSPALRPAPPSNVRMIQ